MGITGGIHIGGNIGTIKFAEATDKPKNQIINVLAKNNLEVFFIRSFNLYI